MFPKDKIERWRDRVRRELVARNTPPAILQEFERESPSDEFLVDQESFDDPSDDFANAINGAGRSNGGASRLSFYRTFLDLGLNGVYPTNSGRFFVDRQSSVL